MSDSLLRISSVLACQRNKKGPLDKVCWQWTQENQMGYLLRSLYPYFQDPDRIINEAFFCVCSRPPSLVWKDAQILPLLGSGKFIRRAMARSSMLFLTQLWFAAAITSNLTCRWSHFQVRLWASQHGGVGLRESRMEFRWTGGICCCEWGW